MGCCISKRPHVDAKTTSDLIKLLDTEQDDIKKIIEKNKVDTLNTFTLHYVNRLHLIKASLLELEMHLKINNERIDDKNNGDWLVVLEIMDKYYELKDRVFVERNDDFIGKDDEIYASPTKEFLNQINIYLGHTLNEE